MNERRAAIRAAFAKIVVNTGVGRASVSQAGFEEKILPQIMRDLALITGQKAETRAAKKSIAGFKIREGQIVGTRITIRGSRMVDFFERLVTIVLPRVRDFRGIDPGGVDLQGALHIGFREQLVFPEIHPEESTFIFPLGVTVVPRTRTRPDAIAAYRELGVPFKKEEKKRK